MTLLFGDHHDRVIIAELRLEKLRITCRVGLCGLEEAPFVQGVVRPHQSDAELSERGGVTRFSAANQQTGRQGQHVP
jgi:hypothetical protein